ncbi:EamA family transporter [Hydrogenophaga sp.]|uniref:EamA family transporter n=1 Tax=Hydrogenophaga sp. TaxID=1904254 RepID=UPI0008AF4740|nr:EamA family transporter [Hydrogenophaga sp.]OGA76803.1 MAG: hypothetical protein A2X73_19900 [Burkholderiales bacterium GWE1_65_30]OGA91720.1 MAG: hypothetical protein A2X72_04805 [Burkholderiales bacterium GWF1_66_17]
MANRFFDHIYILATIAFTVYSQMVLRWQTAKAGELPASLLGKFDFILHLFMNPWVLSGIFSTLLAGISWMLAMSRFNVSYAYPWTALNFVLIMAFGVLFFNETFSLRLAFGTFLVISGIVVLAKG